MIETVPLVMFTVLVCVIEVVAYKNTFAAAALIVAGLMLTAVVVLVQSAACASVPPPAFAMVMVVGSMSQMPNCPEGELASTFPT